MSSSIPLLIVDNIEYRGWTALRVSTAIDHCAGSADLAVTERWPAGEPSPLAPGMRAILKLGSEVGAEVVITGWIDGVSRAIDATRRTIRLSMRDATGDLVDCSAIVRQYSGQTLLQIAQDQLAAGSIGVSANADVGAPFKRVASEPGQSKFEFLERLARQRGVLLMPDGRGNLVIGRPGAALAPQALELGRNLLHIEAKADWKDRFSKYVVYGQSAGDDDWHGKKASEIRAESADPDVAEGRTRLKVVMAEDGETDLAARADWERRVAYGRSLMVQAQVQGWESTSGRLWRAGETVQVKAPGLGITETLLIVGVSYTLDQGGTLTDMELTRSGAFDPASPLPEKDPADDKKPAGWWM